MLHCSAVEPLVSGFCGLPATFVVEKVYCWTPSTEIGKLYIDSEKVRNTRRYGSGRVQAVNAHSQRQAGQAVGQGRAAAGEQQDESQRSWLSHMRGSARVTAAELLGGWAADLRSAGLSHSPQSFSALVQVSFDAAHFPLRLLARTAGLYMSMLP